MGYHFKSIDGMIEDINKQDVETKTNPSTGIARLYKYVYSAKKIDTGEGDQFKIDSVSFPEEKNFLMGLRHGAWSGYSVGFDPVTVNQSRWGGESSELSADMYRYKVSDAWKSMSHLGGKNSVNPMSRLDDAFKISLTTLKGCVIVYFRTKFSIRKHPLVRHSVRRKTMKHS